MTQVFVADHMCTDAKASLPQGTGEGLTETPLQGVIQCGLDDVIEERWHSKGYSLFSDTDIEDDEGWKVFSIQRLRRALFPTKKSNVAESFDIKVRFIHHFPVSLECGCHVILT